MILLLLFSQSRVLAAQPGDGVPQVQIPGTQLLHLTSSIVGRPYDLYINLPRGYQDTSKAFPVLYLLDAQWDFTLVNAIFGEQYYDGFVPACIVVGITWGGQSPNYDSLRARDLTPTFNKQVPQSGNGPQFLAFVKKELIPYIESTYRTTHDRTLMGSSLGGLFTLYAMYHETGLFTRYVLTSPALGWDGEIIYTYDKEYAAQNSDLPVKLFMAIGGLERVPDFQRYIDRLKSHGYKSLDLHTRVIEGIGHSGSKAEGFTRGLQAVFARPSVTVDPRILKEYAGTYELNAEARVTFAEENSHLTLTTPDGTKLTLEAENGSDFYCKGVYLFFKFRKNPDGTISGCQVEQFGGEQFLKRLGS
jgi:predicted alpha/beta superfamily hydrolase